jgi:hypothetical protein
MKKTTFPLSQVYRLLEPGPVVLVTTSRAGRANIMTMSWHTMMEFALADQLELRWPRRAGKWPSSRPPASPAPSPANSSPKTLKTNRRQPCWNASK